MGLNIKLARVKKGLTQKELANKTNMSPATISKIETGKLNLRIDSLIKIAEVLEVPVNELIGD